jgi:cobyrinic acid a,c-diamide synthase
MTAKGIIIAGTSSGSGKTTVTLGIMAALLDMGLKVQPLNAALILLIPLCINW